MGRRQHGLGRDRDEQTISDVAAPARHGGGGGGSLSDHVLNLQRDYGNTAVTGVVVQRTPKRHKTLGAASQDMKDVTKIKPGKAEKKAPVEATFWPTPNARFTDSKLEYLTSEALKWAKADDKNTLLTATEFLEECYLRTKARMWSDILWKTYAKLHDDKRVAFWQKVTHQDLKPPF